MPVVEYKDFADFIYKLFSTQLICYRIGLSRLNQFAAASDQVGIKMSTEKTDILALCLTRNSVKR